MRLCCLQPSFDIFECDQNTKPSQFRELDPFSISLLSPISRSSGGKRSCGTAEYDSYHDRPGNVRIPPELCDRKESQLTEDNTVQGKKGHPSHLLRYLKAGLHNGMGRCFALESAIS
jgi:hypothetical protein